MKIPKQRHHQAASLLPVGPAVSTRRQRLRRAGKLLALTGVLLGATFTYSDGSSVQAAACAAATSDQGADVLTQTIPAETQYTVWVRMIAPDTTNNMINLEIDGTQCFNVGGGAFTETAWNNDSTNWVNYANGTASTPIRLTLTAAPHTFKFIGTSPGVAVDRVIVTADDTCQPIGTGDNCVQTNTGPAPTVNFVSPTANQQLQGNVSLNATATSSQAIQSVTYAVDNKPFYTATSSPYTFDWNSASVANGTHTITATATDSQGTPGTATVSVTTNNSAVCTDPPAAPTGLGAAQSGGGDGSTTAGISWTASTPGANCIVYGYDVYRNGTKVTTVTGGATTFHDTGLTPSTTYQYSVAAIDLADHTSPVSSPYSATTTAATGKPAAPAGLQQSLVTSSSVALSWTAGDATVAGYNVYRDGQFLASTVQAAYTDQTVSPKTTYQYQITALNASSVESDKSAPVSVTTLDGPAGGGGGGGNGGGQTGDSMYIDPASGSYGIGDTFTATVKVNTNSDAVNAAGTDLTYSSNLECQSVDQTASDFAVPATVTCANGTATIERGAAAGTTVSGDKVLGKITFKVLAAGTGTVKLSNERAYSADTSHNVLVSFKDASYTLGAAAPAPPPPPPAPSPNPSPSPAPAPRPTPRPVTSTGGGSTSSGSGTTTTIAPEGNATPVSLPDNSTVELSDPVVVQTVPDSTRNVTKVEYYLNGKLIATVKQPPYSYTVKTDNLKNGTYQLTTKTYYDDGTVDTKTSSLVVKNPMNFKQIMLQFGALIWVLVILLIIAAAAVWYFFFRNNNSGGDDGYGDDGYMFGPINPTDPSGGMGGGGTYGPPAGTGQPGAYSILGDAFSSRQLATAELAIPAGRY